LSSTCAVPLTTGDSSGNSSRVNAPAPLGVTR
jgi:hypothetical protein